MMGDIELRYIERLDGSNKLQRALQVRASLHSPWQDVPVLTMAEQTDAARQAAEDADVRNYE